MTDLALPSRYERLSALGKGGGGEVLAVRERHSGRRYAVKVLASDATEREMAALVREAVALSGLEGLGVPRVMRFGRLADSGRPFMVRELVEGDSLQELVDAGADLERTLEAIARAAEQVTVVHRSGFFHGDIKPANIIVAPDGSATLVDLGLAATWQDEGTQAEGLTPKYAAPELFEGRPLTVRAEVYAFGVTVLEALKCAKMPSSGSVDRELRAVATRATSDEPSERHPSADEFASALRRAAGLPQRDEAGPDTSQLWPIVAIDATAATLFDRATALEAGETLLIDGPAGSGRSALLRRLAWSLGVEGRPIAWIDEDSVAEDDAVLAELPEDHVSGQLVLLDDADRLSETSRERVLAARARGARLVVVGGFEKGALTFEVPALERRTATELVRRSIPSLTERLLNRVVKASGGRPGALRDLVARMATLAIASEEDFDRLLGGSGVGSSMAPANPLDRAVYFLDRGRFHEAALALQAVSGGDDLAIATARARLDLGQGDAAGALARLGAVEALGRERESLTEGKTWKVYYARAHIGTGRYERAIELLLPLTKERGALGAEALAYQGLGESYAGRHDAARRVLEDAVAAAQDARDPRVEGVALASLGLALQRADLIDDARGAYERAISAAERAGDAGMLSTTQLNLAGLLKMGGDIAGAIEHYEGALDMGRRSGRRSTERQALLNLANTDLYLGRLSRARASIEQLEEQRAHLAPIARAQLAGLQAELAARSGQVAQATRLYDACAAAYEALGHPTDAAEARLESVLGTFRSKNPSVAELGRQVARAEEELGDSPAHRPLRMLARARVTWAEGDEAAAKSELRAALEAARGAGQREWVWRTLEARAYLEEAAGQPLLARRDREEALAVLEEIGARLPRDLREVYWDDPRRRALRAAVNVTISNATTEHAALTPGSKQTHEARPVPVVDEQRLARILEINHELAGVHDLDTLTARITDHAVSLLGAERGFVVLAERDGRLTVHTSRFLGADDPHAQFSRSIAEQVIATGEPVVSMSPGTDSRMRSFASVHQLMLQSVACAPIPGPRGASGALYIETRVRPGATFDAEMPALRAFADQVAIAIENARLVTENRARADELAQTNRELEAAQEHLQELLSDRTQKLKVTRKRLRDARETLYGHFGYRGLVGTSAAMRRVYALIDRVKDADVPVLITGESGTGKEVVARAIHASSERKSNPFLGVNCGAIPENLLESELFGHVKGAFTGADRDRRGLFREGEGGTILLDEIGELPHKMQAGLLRVLQERTVRPVGGVAEDPIDVRPVFATNRDLAAMVQARTFREDLYYRIHVVEVALPPLRARTEDIPPLVDYFLGIFSARYKREKKSVTRDAMRRLYAFDWPGNVRQLEHVLLNAWVLSDAEELAAEDFDIPDGFTAPPSTSRKTSVTRTQLSPSQSERTTSQRGPKSTISQHRHDERQQILRALQSCNWNRVKAAQMIGIPRRTFYRRLKDYGIQ